MTAHELIKHFITTYGVNIPWPKTYEVDAETYANCCQYVFIKCKTNDLIEEAGIFIGSNYGLMFKNVELIYRPK